MKAILLSVFMLLCAQASFAQKSIVAGDMNGDNKLDIEDVTLMVSTMLGKRDKIGAMVLEGDAVKKDPPMSSSGNAGGHDYVDLGLPSGTLWATCNVGASTPEGFGNYYAWGETSSKFNCNWSTYRWSKGEYYELTKYITDSWYGPVDNKTTLDLSDDAAYVNWGSMWRMPTDAEQEELINACWFEFTRRNGVPGHKGVSKYNGNTIFFPDAGYRNYDHWQYRGETGYTESEGYYWSRSLREDSPADAFILHFWGIYRSCGSDLRYLGLPVRAVVR